MGLSDRLLGRPRRRVGCLAPRRLRPLRRLHGVVLARGERGAAHAAE